MFSKESQYISVLKFDNQLKIDYKRVNEEKLEKSEESTHIVYDEILPKDIALKLNKWQNDLNKTYITTLCLCDDEKIINKNSKTFTDFNKTSLNEKLDVVIRSSKLFEVEHYFEFTGLDYVFSPFQILNLHLEENPSSNSLIVLTVNNYVYIVIVDELNKIVYNKICKTSTFKDIKESKFYNSEVIGQKLYDEIHALELQTCISDTIKEYYSKTSNNFIEKIDILYTIKQISDETIQQIEDDLLINIHYHYVSLKESLYELSRGVNASKQSFINQRVKKKSSSLKWIVAGFVSIGLITALAFNYQDEIKKLVLTKNELKVEEIKKVPSKVGEEQIVLPNHIEINEAIKNDIKTLLDIVPYDMVLDSLDLKRNNSTLTGKMLTPDSYIKDIQPQFLKLYKYSNIQVKDSKNVALDVIIYNNEMVALHEENKKNSVKYLSDGFMPVKRVTETLKIILPSSAVVDFDSTFNMKITTYNYRVNIICQSPIDFYKVIDDLNREKYSINIAYPILFLKNTNGIEVDFGLQFNQIP